jgi:hypothetical protein
MKTRVLTIDAWRDCEGGWTWNNWYEIGQHELPDGISTRQLLRHARDEGYLTDYSKGRVMVDDDGYNLTICDRGTREPLIAYCYGEFQS